MQRWVSFIVMGLLVGCADVGTRTCSATDGGSCDSTAICGTGTHLIDGYCVADATTCGAGTFLDGGVCVANSGGIPDCGPGTHANNGQCVADEGGLTCGIGTHESNGMCVPDGSSTDCGPGTHLVNGMCQSDSTSTRYALYLDVTQIPADGHTHIPLFAVGLNPDGTFSHDEVVFFASRPNAGSVDPVTAKLTDEGLTVQFQPCNSAQTPSCLGKFRLSMALGNDPTTPVATTPDLELVALPAVGSPAACLSGGNIAYFDGDPGDYIHPGSELIKTGTFNGTATPMTNANHVSIHLMTAGMYGGGWWDFDFDSSQLGQPLMTQVYTDAQRYPFEDMGHPGFDISGDGRGCNMDSGQFQIHDLQVQNGTLKSFTATFAQHCEGGSAALNGCVHFEQ